MPIDHARIRDFLRQGEGAPPPVFVGRDAILEDILTTAKESAGQPKMTRIVQGAPGAGKTSLLHEMQRRWTGEDGTPRVVTVSSEAVSHDTSSVTQAVVAAGTSSQDGWRRILRERIRRLTSVGAAVAGYGLTAEFDVYEQAKLLSTAIRQGQEKAWETHVIVAVDEAQALEGDRHSVAACFLREIHNAVTRLPLTLVLAGLSDTASRARGMNLTRDTFVHETEPLAAAEARDFMGRMAQHFGLSISRHNARLNELAALCEGWPRHLHHAGESLAEAALNVHGDMDRIDWTDVGDETWRRRQKYYRKQYSPQMRRSRSLTATVMRDIPVREAEECGTDLSDVDVLNRIQKACQETGPVEWRLPKGMDAEDFLDHLVHKGAISISDDGTVHSPIPSFRSFLIEAGTGLHPKPDTRKDGGDDGTDLSF